MQTTLRSTLEELGYPLNHDGIERAYLDGIVTYEEAEDVAVTLDGGNSSPPLFKTADDLEVYGEPMTFKSAKFERALDRFSIASLGETEDEAYRRFHFATERLHPKCVLRGPDGRYYAFGNRGTRRDKQPRKVTQLRGGGVN